MQRPKIPPTTVHIIQFKTCWNCGKPATVSIRPLRLQFHRFYCSDCAKTQRVPPSRNLIRWRVGGLVELTGFEPVTS